MPLSDTHVLGLISDTHGLVRPGVHDALTGVELILHAGDVGGSTILDELRLIAPVRAVFGNTDPPGEPGLESEIALEVAGLRVHAVTRPMLAWMVPPEEKNGAVSLTPVAARRFVVARGILRTLLSGFTGTSAEKLRFRYGNSGKPFLVDRDHIHFNITHSADLGLFAFAPDRSVGVDVENERPVRRLLDVAQRFMSDDEIRSLAATAPESRDAAFLKSWVVREARLKPE